MRKKIVPAKSPEIFVEALESRIAPASATFIDVDGDTVTVTTSKGTSAALQALVDTAVGGDPTMASQMQTLALTGAFDKTNLKIAVTKKVAGGDGMVNVWAINATGLDLGNVEVKGDLSKLTAGDATYANGSVKSVKVQSIGVNGGATAKDWLLRGGTTSFTVAGSVNGAALEWENPDASGKISIGTLKIGGDLIGGATDETGSVFVTTGTGGVAEIKTLIIGGNMTATNYHRSGSVIVGDIDSPDAFVGNIGKATVGGSLTGFAAREYSGTIYTSGTLGWTTVEGSLNGGGEGSGSLYSYKAITGVKIGGALDGGAGIYSGSVYAAFGPVGSVEVGGALLGANGSYSGSIISFLGTLGNVKVGSYVSGGSATYAGAIYGQKGLGDVWIGGSVFGGSTTFAGSIGVDDGGGYLAGDVTIRGSLFGGSSSSTGSIIGDTFGDIFILQSMVAGSGAGSGAIYATEAFQSLSVGGNVQGGTANFTASIRALGDTASIDFIKIGGSLLGDDGMLSAGIIVDGSIGSLSIGQNILGGEGAQSASITVTGATSKFYVGGNIIGNGTTGADSAHVDLDTLTTGIIGGSITGGAGADSALFETGTTGSLSIGGGINGGSGMNSGSIFTGSLKSLSVGTGEETGVSIYGGSATNAGIIFGGGSSAMKATLAGHIIGGFADNTGFLQFFQAKDVSIGGDVRGGADDNTGFVFFNGQVSGKLTVGGNVLGSDDLSNTGYVAVGSAKAIEVKGNVVGGDATMANKTTSGAVLATGAITSLTIGRDIVGGQNFNTTDINRGAVRAGSIGTMLVKGSILGNFTNYVAITGQGNTGQTSGTNYAIKSLTVNGSVTYANILGGYNTTGSTLDGAGGDDGGSAQLGTITVLGDFFNSSIATGVSNESTALNHWADGNNVLLAKPAGSKIVASIAKIVIQGASFGAVQNGFAAEQIKSLNLGGFAVPVGPGAQFFPVSQGNLDVQQVVA